MTPRLESAEYVGGYRIGVVPFGAYVPDLPGCVAAGETRDEALALIREAIEFQIEGLERDGQPVAPPSSTGEIVDVAAA